MLTADALKKIGEHWIYLLHWVLGRPEPNLLHPASDQTVCSAHNLNLNYDTKIVQGTKYLLHALQFKTTIS